MSKSKKPDTKAQEEQMASVRLQQASLDEEENRRRKRLLTAASGVRAYAGSAMFRRSAKNRPGTAPAQTAGTAMPQRNTDPGRSTGGSGRTGRAQTRSR